MSKITKLILFCLILILFVSACSGEEVTPEVPPQMEIVTLQTTPSLEHWLADVANCAGGIPDLAVVTHIHPLAELDLDQADLLLRLGERQESDPFVAVMGTEQTVIVVGSDVPVDSLSLASLQRIFAGEWTNWNEVPEIQEAEIEINQPIQTLSYPENHELRLLFQQSYLGDEEITSSPLIFSTEAYLENLLESHPYAIGHTLESIMPVGAQMLAVLEFDEAQAQHNVLAITPEEPTGRLRQLLLCLQN